MKKELKKALGMSLSLALAVQMMVPVIHAETLAETVKSELNVSETYHTKDNNGTTFYVSGVKDVDSNGDGKLDTISTWYNEFVPAETEGVGRDAIKFTKEGEGFTILKSKAIKDADGYCDVSLKINYDTSVTISSGTEVFGIPWLTYKGDTFRFKYKPENTTLEEKIKPNLNEWLDFRILFDYREDEGVIYKRLYEKNDDGVFVALTEWLNIGSNSFNTADEPCYIKSSAPDEAQAVMYVNTLKLATVNNVELMIPKIVSMEGSGDELKLTVSTELDSDSVTLENLDIPVGTVTNLSYQDKVITLTGTNLMAAFLTENILSADGMAAEASSFVSNVSDQMLFALGVNENYEEETNYTIVKTPDLVSYVPATENEREYLAFEGGAYSWSKKNIAKEGYMDLGVRSLGVSEDPAQVIFMVSVIGLKLQLGKWMTGAGSVLNDGSWQDFRMLVKAEDDGTLSKKFLLKNDEGIYEDITSWINTGSDAMKGYFTLSAYEDFSADISEFEYINSASDTWYPEIIGTESFLDGKILRVYTNRPLMASTVNADSIILASGSAEDFIVNDNVITIIGEGLTSAELTGLVATADGMRKGVKTATYSDGAVSHDCGTVTLTVDSALSDEEIASLEDVKLVAGDVEISAEAEYSEEDLTIILAFGELERLMYSGKPEMLQPAVYNVVIPGLRVNGTIEISDIPFEWLQVSSEYKAATGSVEGITYKSGAPEYVAKTEESRAYLLGKDDTIDAENIQSTLFYGLKATGHKINEPIYIDMSLNATDGKVNLNIGNVTDITGASGKTADLLSISGNVTDVYPEAYVASDGFSDFRIALTQKANGSFEKAIYNKNVDGNYVLVREKADLLTAQNKLVAGDLYYLALGIDEGGKVAKLEIYKENPEELIPAPSEAKFTDTGASFTFSHDMADITAENVTVYEGETEISKEISYDSATKTLTVTAADATKVIINGVYAKNGMPADEIIISRSLGADLTITDSEGNILSDLTDVTSVKATAEIKNRNTDATTYSIYIARFNGEKLVSVVSDSKEVTAGAWADFEVTLTDENGFVAGDYVKAYLWDENMKPVCDSEVVNYSVVETLAQNEVLAARVASESAEGDDLDVVYIGGSITYGSGGSPCWVELVSDVFDAAYPGKVTNHNSGEGGTTSLWGITRFDRDVLSHDPDVVFIEFAVNDENISITQAKEAMEGMVRQLNALENPPMVAFVYTTRYNDSNGAVIAAHQEIADYYNIPAINLRDYVWNTYWGGEAPTDEQVADFWTDKTHPTALGYSVYADYIISNMVKDGFFRYPEVKETPYVESYIKNVGRWLTTEELENTIEDFYGWELGTGDIVSLSRSEASGDASMISFAFEGSMFVLKYDRYTDKGNIIVTIDETIVKTINCNYDNGNGGHAPGMYGVYDLDDGEHTVSIEFAEQDGRKNASISDVIVAK